MSWSVGAIGKAARVREEISRQFGQSSKCIEPEETVRQAAASLIDASLAAQDPTMAIKVLASGSQSFRDYQAKTGVQNYLSIQIEPQSNFLE